MDGLEITYQSEDGVSSDRALGDLSKDPNLPCYEMPEYQAVFPYLELSGDIYAGITAWMGAYRVSKADKAVRYLPKEEMERPKQYAARLLRSVFINFYKPTIKGFAGLLSDFSLSDNVPQSLLANIKNVNLQGDNLATFLCLADELVLRDGFCGILVDFPEQPKAEDGTPLIQTAEDELRFGLRPYLSIIERKKIVNWRYEYTQGRQRLTQATIKRSRIDSDGLFGVKHVTEYQVWEPGRYTVFEKRKTGKSVQYVQVDEKTFSLPVIPLVIYSGVVSDPFVSLPPLYHLAVLNISHYREMSDYVEVRRKCNLPVPVRKGLLGELYPDPAQLPDLVIGPNSTLDIPGDGDFYFAEPTGAAIAATRQAIIDLEGSILREALNFFGSDDTTQKTAKEVELRSSQTRAALSMMAEAKESAVEEMFSLWSQWMNTGPDGGTITINKTMLTSPLSPQAVQVFSSLVTLGQLDIESFIQILKDGKVIPKEIEVESVLERIGQTVARPLAGLERSQEVLNGSTNQPAGATTPS